MLTGKKKKKEGLTPIYPNFTSGVISVQRNLNLQALQDISFTIAFGDKLEPACILSMLTEIMR